MRQLYLDCSMGAAGDMLSAALFELVKDKETTLNVLNGFGIPGVTYTAEPSVKCGITGTHFKVKVFGQEEMADQEEHHHEHFHGEEHHHEHEHFHGEEHHHEHEHFHGEEHHHEHEHFHGEEHHHEHEHFHEEHHHHHHHHEHHGLAEICALIDGLNASENVRENAKEVYALIAQAEAKVHGKEMDNIHFHEVGTWDAVADVMAVCYLMEQLGAEHVTVSGIRTGYGTVKCAHGILPVPAPATQLLLEGMPVFAGDIGSEMCTPTGAALLKFFADDFGNMPAMTMEAAGYGMGYKDFEQHANCVRATLGETSDDVIELTCNVDDMVPEDIGFAFDMLLSGGALDVWYEQISMKKNRPGIQLCCLCRPDQREEMVRLIFRHTTTIGIRESICRRYVLRRSEGVVETEYGNVRYKASEGYGICRKKAEYDDLARIAKETNLSIADVRKSAADAMNK